MRHVHITVFGNVQGVGFRYFARAAAEEMNIAGFAENHADGTVYIEAEGESAAIDRFIAWCRKGPPMARVERVVVREGTQKGLKNFEAR